MAKKRKAGDGLIRQRADGRWEGRYVVGYDDHGYPKTKAVFGKSKRECTEKLAALKAQLGGIPSDKLRPEMRFADWLDYWYETHCKPNIRTSTQSGYEDRIRLHIKPELGEIPLNRLTQNDLQQFYARLKKSGRKTRTECYGEGLSDRMVRMCHATCRSALQRAVQDGLIRTNPAEGCKLPPKKRARCRCWRGMNCSGFSFKRKPRVTMNCSCWIWQRVCGAGNCWRCNGMTSILKRASSRSANRSVSSGARSS